MAIEIRELKIKGIVSHSSNSRMGIVREFENRNSNIINSAVLRDMKLSILAECNELIQNEFEKQNQR
jgi:hypothetical protein